jgi:hypothetical protein
VQRAPVYNSRQYGLASLFRMIQPTNKYKKQRSNLNLDASQQDQYYCLSDAWEFLHQFGK